MKKVKTFKCNIHGSNDHIMVVAKNYAEAEMFCIEVIEKLKWKQDPKDSIDSIILYGDVWIEE